MKTTFKTIFLSSLIGAPSVMGGLIAYDDQINTDNSNGLAYTARTMASFIFDGSNSEPFDFGATSGSGAIEVIVKGDPVAGGQDGFLAQGSNGTFSLRYEQWDDTGVLGFTHGGVADYVFTPEAVPPPDIPLTDTPTELAHIAYRWDHTTSTMELFVNGSLIAKRAAPGFLFPSGSGFLGNNAGLTEGMSGTIERATVYNEAVDAGAILAHSDAWQGPGGSLANYDSVIAADNAGTLPHTGISSSTLTFDTTNNEVFDFGAVFDSATAEFIVTGDPVAGGQNGFLGVGADPIYNLRFEQWNDTGKLGFTHGGVADYTFGPLEEPEGPSLESPTEFVHLVYQYDSATGRMDLYIDGVLAGFNASAPGFELPSGLGQLGNNGGLSEGMIGEIARVTVYDEMLTPEAIASHANAWLGPDDLDGPLITTISKVASGDDALVSFTWTSRPATTYIVERSDDLVTWFELDDSHPSGGATTTFEETITDDNVPVRYYRVTAN